ncbi:MAG: DUF2804 domain-containing protein [Halomonadaceae bacterium]|nr:MAG: DUF2804 domain-containing protein [Halomonadaceae bacterium]
MTKTLIDAQSQPVFGFHTTPVGRVNYQDYDLRTMMDRKRSRLARTMAFNQFQFIGLTGPDWIGGIAIVDLKWLSVGFFYLYDIPRNERLEHSFQRPLAAGTTIEPDPDNGKAQCRSRATSIQITPEGDTRRIQLRDSKRGIDADLCLHGTGMANPLRLCSPAGYQRWSFTQKWAGLSVEGQWRWGDRRYECSDQQGASIDWSCGHMRRETAWNWASLSGFTDSGERVGLNLATGINESGVSENALWVEGQQELLAQAQFTFDRYDRDSAWQIRTRDARVELYFEPLGCRAERINAGVIASNFRQFYGYFTGTLQTQSGELLKLSRTPGFVEDHYARW